MEVMLWLEAVKYEMTKAIKREEIIQGTVCIM